MSLQIGDVRVSIVDVGACGWRGCVVFPVVQAHVYRMVKSSAHAPEQLSPAGTVAIVCEHGVAC